MDEIRLNSLELQLSDVNVVSESCDDIPVQQVVMDTANEQAVIHLSSTLHQGTFYLKLSFHGNVVDKPNGLYFNKYIKYYHK